MDLRQILLLILSEFKWIYWLLFSQKSSENLWFCNDFRTNRIKLIRLTSPKVRSEICGQSLENIYDFYHKRSSNLFKTWFTVFCWLKKPRNGSKYSLMDRPLSKQTISLQMVERLFSTNFTWPIFEYFVPKCSTQCKSSIRLPIHSHDQSATPLLIFKLFSSILFHPNRKRPIYLKKKTYTA